VARQLRPRSVATTMHPRTQIVIQQIPLHSELDATTKVSDLLAGLNLASETASVTEDHS
jgi:hypothetical protein